MKVKKEIEVTICDFCENEAIEGCPICGKDVCQSHELTLHVHFRAQGEGLTGHPSSLLTRHFCPDHLTEELNKDQPIHGWIYKVTIREKETPNQPTKYIPFVPLVRGPHGVSEEVLKKARELKANADHARGLYEDYLGEVQSSTGSTNNE